MESLNRRKVSNEVTQVPQKLLLLYDKEILTYWKILKKREKREYYQASKIVSF